MVGPDEALSPDERRALEKLAATSPSISRPGVEPVRFDLVERLPWPGANLDDWADSAPASVEAAGSGLQVTHRRYAAAIDPEARTVHLFRTDGASAAVEVTLRVALAAQLPSLGALPLHAAGIVLEGAGHVFFGPSGAGKSTLSGLAPGPVVSDELVAVTLEPPQLQSTGFWGEMGEGPAAPSSVPLAALVELAHGDAFRLEPLDPTLALRRLLGVLLVPPLPSLWGEAMSLAARLARRVPVYRMEWTPEAPPWDALRRALLSA